MIQEKANIDEEGQEDLGGFQDDSVDTVKKLLKY